MSIEKSKEIIKRINEININSTMLKCEYEGCNKYFNCKANLIRHSYVHSGDKPFTCHVCSKSFNQQGNLNIHMKSHDNIEIKWDRKTTKEFKCTFIGCTQSYKVKSSLYNHMNKHKNDSIPNAIYNLPKNQIPAEKGLYTSVPGNGFDNLLVAVKASQLPCPINNKMMGRCLHQGCNHVFDKANGVGGLRAHLFQHAPGLQAEARAMREIMINLIAILDSWDLKTTKEKVKISNYVDSVRNTLSNCDVECYNNRVRSIHGNDVKSITSSNYITQTISESESGNSFIDSNNNENFQLIYDSDDESNLIGAILNEEDNYYSNTLNCNQKLIEEPKIDVLCCEPCIYNIQNIILHPDEEKFYIEQPLVEANNEILLGWMEHIVTDDNNNIAIQFNTNQNDSEPNQKKKKKNLINENSLKSAFGFKV